MNLQLLYPLRILGEAKGSTERGLGSPIACPVHLETVHATTFL